MLLKVLSLSCVLFAFAHAVPVRPKVCTECKAFASQLKHAAVGDSARNDVQMYFKNVCESFGPFKQSCEDTTSDLVKQLFATVKHEIPVDVACDLLSFCDDGADNVKTNQMALQGAKYFYGLYLQPPTQHRCDECQIVMSHVKDILLKADVQETAGEYWAAKWCVAVELELMEECKKIVKLNVGFAFEVFADKISDGSFCEGIDMCKASANKPSTAYLVGNALGKYASSFFEDNQSNMKNPIDDIKQEILNKLKELEELVKQLEKDVESEIESAISETKAKIDQLEAELNVLKAEITTEIENLYNEAVATAEEIENKVKEEITIVYNQAEEALKEANETYNRIKDKAEQALNDVLQKIKDMLHPPTTTLLKNQNKMKRSIDDIKQEILEKLNQLKEQVKQLEQAMQSQVESEINEAKEKIHQIEAEMKVLKDEITVKVEEKYNEALATAEEVENIVKEEISKVYTEAEEKLKEANETYNRIKDKAVEDFNDVLEKIKNMLNRPTTILLEKPASSVSEQNQKSVEDIKQEILDKLKQLEQELKQLEQDIENGIESAMDSTKQKIIILEGEIKVLKDDLAAEIAKKYNDAAAFAEEIKIEVKAELSHLYDEAQVTLSKAAETFERIVSEGEHAVENVIEKIKHYLNPNNSQSDSLTSFIQPPVSVKQTDGSCNMCSMFTREMLTMLAMEKSQESILENINEFCDELPDPLGAQCRDVVATEGSQLLKEFLDMLTPNLVCRALGFCEEDKTIEAPVQTPVEVTKPVHKEILKQKSSEDDQSAWCGICHIIVELVQEDVHDVYKSAELSTISKQMCTLLKDFEISTKVEECITSARVVEMAAYEVFKEVSSPVFACQAIGVCMRPHASTVLKFKSEN